MVTHTESTFTGGREGEAICFECSNPKAPGDDMYCTECREGNTGPETHSDDEEGGYCLNACGNVATVIVDGPGVMQYAYCEACANVPMISGGSQELDAIETPKPRARERRLSPDSAYRLINAARSVYDLPADEREPIFAAYNVAEKCPACDEIRPAGERFCWHCGIDHDSLDGRILDTITNDLEPVSFLRSDPKSLAASARKAFTRLVGTGHGISVTMARGTAYGYISVRRPEHTHWQRCLRMNASYLQPISACPQCQHDTKASRHLDAILEALFPCTDNRNDSQRDYFDFVWSVS